MKFFLVSIIACLLFTSINAQEITKQNKNAIGVFGGLGFGIDYARTLKVNKLYAAVSYNSFVFSVNDLEQEFSGEELLIDNSIDFRNVDLKLNYHPFSNAFKLVGGIGFFSSSNVNIKTEFKTKKGKNIKLTILRGDQILVKHIKLRELI